MESYLIRPIKKDEIYLLETFLYEAIFQREGDELLPRSVINEPELKVFIENFGREHDYCLVAECDNNVVGAVWCRILAGETKGFGNIDSETPEFAISVLKNYRSKGIGKALMKKMLLLLKEKGYPKTSLAVQKDNYALHLYQKVGFEIIRETEQEYIMVNNLKKDEFV